MKYSILDCTLRDGGYYNDWDFDPEVVRDYLVAVASAKIEYVELGFRSFDKGLYDTFISIIISWNRFDLKLISETLKK
jgi:isopropylmalate/homocitrate/citramalate synthase